MKISKKIAITITFVVIFCALATAIVFVGLSSREQTIPVKSLIRATIQETALSESGINAKKNLIASLNGKSGALLATQDMGVGYIPPPGEKIAVYILGNNVEQIEQDAISWLMSRGFSKTDLCYLPVIFSVINPEAQTNKKYKLSMDYIPEFCSEILGVE